MKKTYRLLIACLTCYLSGMGQTQPSMNRMVSLIATVPQHYSIPYKRFAPKSILSKQDGGWFNIIVKYDTAAISFLINLINDTTTSKAINTCSNSNYKIGDLAVMLINDIEPMPYATITNMQWCLPGECGILPYGFMDYVNSHRKDFQSEYQAYYFSNERQDILNTKQCNRQQHTTKL